VEADYDLLGAELHSIHAMQSCVSLLRRLVRHETEPAAVAVLVAHDAGTDDLAKSAEVGEETVGIDLGIEILRDVRYGTSRMEHILTLQNKLHGSIRPL
jgi:hypothetical protein